MVFGRFVTCEFCSGLSESILFGVLFEFWVLNVVLEAEFS